MSGKGVLRAFREGAKKRLSKTEEVSKHKRNKKEGFTKKI